MRTKPAPKIWAERTEIGDQLAVQLRQQPRQTCLIEMYMSRAHECPQLTSPLLLGWCG
jgi:hypothetical protein